jgi:hypothetical protein
VFNIHAFLNKGYIVILITNKLTVFLVLKIKQNLGASSVPAFFSEDDSQSNDSSDSDSSSSQSDDIEQETFMLDEPLERTTNSSHASGAAQAPRSMQWAVRNTQHQRAASTAPSSTSTPTGKSENSRIHRST